MYALACAALERLGCTIQICDSGIAQGSGGRVSTDLIANQIVELEKNQEIRYADEKIYPTALYNAEWQIADHLHRLLTVDPEKLPATTIEKTVTKVADQSGITYDQVQKEAIKTALNSKVMLLTGGPGTGKTTFIPKRYEKQYFNWLDNIQYLVSELEVPVIVKEVGFGMSKTTIAKLQTHDVHLINVSGRGGTNFAAIENRRNHDINFESLLDWGQTTPESLLEAHSIRRGKTEIIASGGITSPLDVIKAGVLGARAVGVAGYFLNILQNEGYDALDQTLGEWQVIVKRLLALLGCSSFTELSRVEYVLGTDLLSYARQRHLR